MRKQQDYILKKYVKANSAAEALALDNSTPVTEVILAADKPDTLADAVGFKTITLEED